MRGTIAPKAVDNILNGITDAGVARSTLGAARTTYGTGGAEGYIRNDLPNADQLFLVQSQASANATQAGKNVWLVVRNNGVNVWNATDSSALWDLSVPVPTTQGGTGATTIAGALQNLHISYTANETFTINNAQTCGHISGGTQTIEFTVWTPKLMNSISTITITSLSACIRTIGGTYINGGSYRWDQYVGTSGYTVSATKVTNNAFRVTIQKSSAFTSVTNNTPLAISYNITAKVT